VGRQKGEMAQTMYTHMNKFLKKEVKFELSTVVSTCSPSYLSS
jgi:hypothetical protein